MLDFLVHFEGVEPFSFDESALLVVYNKIASDHGRALGALSLVFCSEEYITSVNISFLDHNYATDIITFDYCADGVVSGDLLLCPSVIKQNAIELGFSYEEELSRVCIHGLLHLVGYKDKLPEDVKIMRSKENHYLPSTPFFNE